MKMPVLESSPLPLDSPDDWAEGFLASLRAQRKDVGRFLASHRGKLERAETALGEQIERLEAAVDNRPADAVHGDNREPDLDYQRRYEMALDDLRELKESNAELLQQLAKCSSAKAEPSGAGRMPGACLDWESQKKRMIAALEADIDENDPQQSAERLRIEEVLQTTEQVLVDKDSEIAELRRQLEGLPRGIENVAPAAAAADPSIDDDAGVQEERERLRQLQEQWQGKLRQAEIEISMERAKLARQRTEMEERMRLLESNASQTPGSAPAAGQAETPARGRWLSRLGLTDADRERGRRH